MSDDYYQKAVNEWNQKFQNAMMAAAFIFIQNNPTPAHYFYLSSAPLPPPPPPTEPDSAYFNGNDDEVDVADIPLPPSPSNTEAVVPSSTLPLAFFFNGQEMDVASIPLPPSPQTSASELPIPIFGERDEEMNAEQISIPSTPKTSRSAWKNSQKDLLEMAIDDLELTPVSIPKFSPVQTPLSDYFTPEKLRNYYNQHSSSPQKTPLLPHQLFVPEVPERVPKFSILIEPLSSDVICATCLKSYKNRKALSRHLKTHEEKAFQCHKCNKKFPRRDHLNRHLKTHSGAQEE